MYYVYLLNTVKLPPMLVSFEFKFENFNFQNMTQRIIFL